MPTVDMGLRRTNETLKTPRRAREYDAAKQSRESEIGDFEERVTSAAVKLGLVESNDLDEDEIEDLVELAADGRIEEPRSSLGRYLVRHWEQLSLVKGESLVYWLKLFVGGLTDTETLVAQVEQFRRDRAEQLEVLREIEPTNTRRGHDRYHWFLLRLGLEDAEHDVRWADWVLSELEKG